MIKENMQWPISSNQTKKMMEYSAWYSGDPTELTRIYSQITVANTLSNYNSIEKSRFWARQLNNKVDMALHVPIAGDIASISSDLLFSESPKITLENTSTQETLDNILMDNGFYRKIIEAAETCAAMGGVFVKVAWDSELNNFPMVVIEQIDTAIPSFSFGELTEVTFWKTVRVSESGNKYHRLFETYTKDGEIRYNLFFGSATNLGFEVSLDSIEECQGIKDIETGINDILCVYVPNILPNRLDRSSCHGRSDYAGIEGLMDALDETYSAWMYEIAIAKAKIIVPQQYMEKIGSEYRYNLDTMVYTELDIDPISDSQKITPVQFLIRANDFEKTTLNLLERTITSAGYSPQTIGLNIAGRAESGTALNIRERKSTTTKSKKESYWEPSLKKLIRLIMVVGKKELGIPIDAEENISIEFCDGLATDLMQTSQSLALLTQALSASTETKVRILHNDWNEEQIQKEVEMIMSENALGALENPDETEYQNGDDVNV